MQLFYQPDIIKGDHFLDAEESRHCTKVLRKREGDEINIVDGKGGSYKAVISDANHRKCSFTIKEAINQEQKNYSIHIAIAPTKNADRIEWFVEKAIEIGIDTITFIECEHSERGKVNLARLSKKAVSAMKQSLKSFLPDINSLQSFKSFTESVIADQKFIAYVDYSLPQHLKDAVQQKKDYVIVIGPEGDFSKAEIDLAYKNGFKAVSLGKSRLRTETAGLVACHIFNLVND